METQQVKLKDVAWIVTGMTPSGRHEDNWGGSVPFLTPSDFKRNEYSPVTERSVSEPGVTRATSRIVSANSVAVVCIGSTIGKVALIRTSTLTNQQINTVVPKGGLLIGLYAYYLLGTLEPMLRSIAGGSATPIISKSRFEQISIQIPPLDEQRRIAGVLGALDDLIDTNEKQRNLLLELGRSVFRSFAVDAELTLEQVTLSAARGVTPKYSELEDSLVVLNQKCIRDSRVELSVARSSPNAWCIALVA